MDSKYKVGIITHYDVHNHGALLQLNALIRVLGKKGIEAKALRFDKNYDFMGHDMKSKYEISIRSAKHYWKFLKERGAGSMNYNYKKRKTLNRFKEESGIIGDYYSESPQLDGVFIGSDEVFALHTGPTLVFFGYCLPTDNVVSYAGSFGPTSHEEIERLHAVDFVRGGLMSMKGITVRDHNSAEIVGKLTGKTPEIVVDPVLLYGYKEEISKLSPPPIKNYLLIYAYDNRMNEQEEVEAIKKYAKSQGLKIVSAGFYHSWCDYNVDVDPIKLLAYFKYADIVVTDTFHGSVLSLITEAQFIAKSRESNHFKLLNLLKEYGADNRLIEEWGKMDEKFQSDIDYSKVNIEIERRRDKSMEALQGLLADCNIKA